MFQHITENKNAVMTWNFQDEKVVREDNGTFSIYGLIDGLEVKIAQGFETEKEVHRWLFANQP